MLMQLINRLLLYWRVVIINSFSVGRVVQRPQNTPITYLRKAISKQSVYGFKVSELFQWVFDLKKIMFLF